MTSGITQSVTTPAPGNTARSVVEALFRHCALFAATVGLVLFGTVLITLATTPTYESEMNILVRNARPDYLISPERSTGQIMQQEVTEERINSEIDVLRSKDVADVVADPDWATTPVAQRTEIEIRQHEKAVADFSKHLTVEPMRKSNVIRVAYVTTSPRAATDTVDRLLKAFLAKQHEIEHSSGASSFFAAEAERYKKELDRAQESLAAYQQDKQFVSLADKENTLQTQINSVEDAIRSAQVQITEAENRVASSKHQLAMLPPRLSTQQRSVPNTQAVEQLTALLTNYQNKRTELLTRYQPGDRLIAEVDQQIATTSSALANARATNGQESTTDINPVYQEVKSGLTMSTTDLAALRGRLADLTSQRDHLRKQLVGVEGSTVDYSTLQSRVQELQNNYQLYSQKKNEAQIADAMDQQELVNVAVAERPTFSAKPYRPLVLVNLAMGLFTALFFAFSAVFFAELGRDTIATPAELEVISSAAVLATVPLIAEIEPGFAMGGRSPRSPRRRSDPDDKPVPEAPTGGIGDFAGAAFENQPAFTDTLRPAMTYGALALSPTYAELEEVEMENASREEARRLNRATLLTYEQLAAAPSNPAHPISPFCGLEIAAAPQIQSEIPALIAIDNQPGIVVAEPQPIAAVVAKSLPVPAQHIEPVDPNHRQPSRALSDPAMPARSRLTPSQRAQLRRPSAPSESRASYVTYTIDPKTKH